MEPVEQALTWYIEIDNFLFFYGGEVEIFCEFLLCFLSLSFFCLCSYRYFVNPLL